MQRLVFAFLAGSLFGAGLFLSGMTDTDKVQGFLDIFGAWDPTLAFVMGGAMLPMAIAWRIARRRERAVLGDALPGPASARIDGSLIAGSVMFGAGWGLVGICPGPAIASFSYGGPMLFIFVAAMLGGMALAPMVRERLDKWGPAE